MKPVALKLHTYETIYRLNRAFELVRLNLERLEKSGLFRREFLHIFRVMAEELRAEANFELIDILRQREEKDWARFARSRHRWEKRLRDPQDVLIEASQLQQQQRKATSNRKQRS